MEEKITFAKKGEEQLDTNGDGGGEDDGEEEEVVIEEEEYPFEGT